MRVVASQASFIFNDQLELESLIAFKERFYLRFFLILVGSYFNCKSINQLKQVEVTIC